MRHLLSSYPEYWPSLLQLDFVIQYASTIYGFEDERIERKALLRLSGFCETLGCLHTVQKLTMFALSSLLMNFNRRGRVYISVSSHSLQQLPAGRQLPVWMLAKRY